MHGSKPLLLEFKRKSPMFSDIDAGNKRSDQGI